MVSKQEGRKRILSVIHFVHFPKCEMALNSVGSAKQNKKNIRVPLSEKNHEMKCIVEMPVLKI